MLELEQIVSQIFKDYPEDRVCEIFDQEVLEWVDSDWEDEHESEYEWYCDYGTGEAEDAVIKDMINSWVTDYNTGIRIDPELRLKVYDSIRDNYDVLNNG